MFKFWFEKFISASIPIITFFSLITIFVYAVHTTVSVLPADEAAFIQEMRAEAKVEGSKNIVTLEKAHMADKELKNWITMVASESLAFNKKTFTDNLQRIRPYFTQAGFRKYQAYLLSSGIAENIRTSDYDMRIYIQDRPLLLNSSSIGGTYKWLYRMPVVVSFLPTGVKNLAEDAEKYINSKVTLRLQITRAKVDGNPDAILIEDWIVVPY